MLFRYFSVALFLITSSFYSAVAAERPSIGTKVFGKASPSVVLIRAAATSGTVQGSGVAFSHGYDDNHRPNRTWIVTNAHVVGGNDKVTIENAGKVYAGKVEYADPDLDVALVTLAGVVIPVARLYGGDAVPIGEKVFALGSPLGLENSITEGIISGRRLFSGVMVLQTSAPISSGNSGGGLFDSSGQLLGITTFKLKSGENLNFAIEAKYALVISEAHLEAEMVRIDAEEFQALGLVTLSPANVRDIKSPLLTKWLLTKTSGSGVLMYKESKNIMNDYLADKNPANAKRQYDTRKLSIVQQFVAEAAQHNPERPTAPAIAEKNRTLRLACPLFDENGKFVSEYQLRIDPTSSTINQGPATFTSDKVVFTKADKKRPENTFKFTLNRYSGLLVVDADGYPAIYTGKCTKVGERQF